ncbi:hypothetical protein ABZU25_22790 [Micromonospora sp. NPDC005215]|uniref:hypothetical protein n=1 Tax=Micromonospora sp. NPDC005215 TaxID=3157024 RepID=UPI0033A059EB
MSHVLPLGGTGWSVWRDVVLRTAGFPAEGLADFAAPDAADALLSGVDTADERSAVDAFDKAFAS